MKILHLITRMDRGGSAINTLLSGIEQCKLGHTVTLAYGPSLESDMSSAECEKVDAEVKVFEALGGRIIILPSMLRSLGRHDWTAFDEIRGVLGEGFDVIHTHTSKAGALGRLAARGLAVAIVHTPHGHIFHGYFGILKSKIFIAIERILARQTSALIALTYAERADHLALSIGKPEQWRVIPSGVDIESITQAVLAANQATNQASDADKQWDAVSVGRLVPIKGMERLLLAWHEVCKHKPEARLALVGDGEERARLEAMVDDLGIRENVHFAGWTDPIPYLASARCFALLSHNEGMGRAVVEAFAAGLPCVVSDVCGLRELVEPSVGRVVNADEPKKVAAALLTAWPESVPAAARKRAEDYSVATMIRGLEKVYAEVQAGGHANFNQ